MADTENNQQVTNSEVTRMLLEQFSNNAIQLFRRMNSKEFDFNTTDTQGTERVWVRLTPELVDYTESLSDDFGISSRELTIGACVAFAASHPDALRNFVFYHSFPKEYQEALRAKHGENPTPDSDTPSTQDLNPEDEDLTSEEMEEFNRMMDND